LTNLHQMRTIAKNYQTMGKIIAVVNQKGGVGKTTTSVNVAAALAHQGYRTLLLDLDPQGHSTEHMGVRNFAEGDDEKTVLQILHKQREASGCVVPTYLPKLWVMPANLRLGQFNQDSPQGRQFALKEGLGEDIKDKYDYIIIDCQPSLSLLTLNALTVCDYVLLPVQAEFFALDGLTQLIITLKEVQTKLHPKLSVLGVLVTMYDRRNKLSYEVKHELQKNFGDDLFKITIPRSVKLAEAPSFGQSIFEYDPKSYAAERYAALARELMQRVDERENGEGYF